MGLPETHSDSDWVRTCGHLRAPAGRDSVTNLGMANDVLYPGMYTAVC